MAANGRYPYGNPQRNGSGIIRFLGWIASALMILAVGGLGLFALMLAPGGEETATVTYTRAVQTGGRGGDEAYPAPYPGPEDGERKPEKPQDPGNGGDNPGNGGDNPGNGGDNPGNGGDNPGNGGDNPGNGGDNPGNGGLSGETRAISAKALDDHSCDSSEWHFVITQLDSAQLAPESISVRFSDGATVSIGLEKVSGSTAHYRLIGEHLSASVLSATTEIYSEWSGQFNLSHGPCGGGSEEPTLTPTDTPPPGNGVLEFTGGCEGDCESAGSTVVNTGESAVEGAKLKSYYRASSEATWELLGEQTLETLHPGDSASIVLTTGKNGQYRFIVEYGDGLSSESSTCVIDTCVSTPPTATTEVGQTATTEVGATATTEIGQTATTVSGGETPTTVTGETPTQPSGGARL